MDSSISVIIPAYRAEPFIRRAVQSALGQTASPSEIVIASDDGVDYAALLREGGLADPRIRCVFTGAVRVRSRQRAQHGAGRRAAAGSSRRSTRTTCSRRVPWRSWHRWRCCTARRTAAPSFIDQATGTELESLDRRLPTGLVGLEDVLTSQIHTYAGIVFDREPGDGAVARVDGALGGRVLLRALLRRSRIALSRRRTALPLPSRQRVDLQPSRDGEGVPRLGDELMARLDRGDTLELRNPVSRRDLPEVSPGPPRTSRPRSSRRWRRDVPDFHAFTRRRLDLFHRLAPDVLAVAGG